MIDALYKDRLDRFWDRVGARVARTGLDANALTWLGLAGNLLNAAAFAVHREPVVFGLLLALTELLDNLDGAVARVTGGGSRAGAFLDATGDRYRELAPLLAVALVTGHWLLCFLAVTGSLLTSYAAARADALAAGRAAGAGLPDLCERFERVALLCLGLVASPLSIFGSDPLFLALCALAVLSHATALQRSVRAYAALRREARGQGAPVAGA